MKKISTKVQQQVAHQLAVAMLTDKDVRAAARFANEYLEHDIECSRNGRVSQRDIKNALDSGVMEVADDVYYEVSNERGSLIGNADFAQRVAKAAEELLLARLTVKWK